MPRPTRLRLPRRQTSLGMLMALLSSLTGGAGGVLIAGVALNAYAAVSISCFASALVLAAIARLQGQRLYPALRRTGLRRILLISVMDAGGAGCYYLAVRHAPVGPAIAVQLMAPVLLMTAAVIARRRRLSIRGLSSFVLIGGALLLIGLTTGDNRSASHAWIGFGFAILSAASVAGFLTLAQVAIQDLSIATAGALVGLTTGILTSPALLVGHVSLRSAAIVAGLAILFYTPATLLYWAAIRRLPSTTVGNFRLTEPFFGSLIAYTAYGATLNLLQLLVMLLVVVGIYLDLTDLQQSDNAPASLPRDAGP